jgi:hypothetical protein
LAGQGFVDRDRLSKNDSRLEAVFYRAFEAVFKAILSRAVSKALSGTPLSVITTIV